MFLLGGGEFLALTGAVGAGGSMKPTPDDVLATFPTIQFTDALVEGGERALARFAIGHELRGGGGDTDATEFEGFDDLVADIDLVGRESCCNGTDKRISIELFWRLFGVVGVLLGRGSSRGLGLLGLLQFCLEGCKAAFLLVEAGTGQFLVFNEVGKVSLDRDVG